MKRIIVLVLAYLICYGYLNAQQINSCSYPNGNWTQQPNLVLEYSDIDYGKTIEFNSYVGYYTQNNILHIDNVNFAPGTATYPSIYEVIRIGILKLISQSDKIFNIQNPEVEYTIFIEYPSCWAESRWYWRETPYVTLNQCENNECCKVQLTLKKEFGFIKIITPPIWINGINNCDPLQYSGIQCGYKCGILDIMPPSDDPYYGICNDYCGGGIPVEHNYLPNGIMYNSDIKVAPKFMVSTCNDGTINIAFQEVTKLSGICDLINDQECRKKIIKLCTEYALKNLTGTNPNQKVVVYFPCFEPSQDGTKLMPCVPEQPCCKIIFNLDRDDKPPQIEQPGSESYCQTNPNVPTLGGAGPNDFHFNEPLTPEEPCPDECYWRITGNSNIDDNINFIGSTKANEKMVFKTTGSDGIPKECMAIFPDGTISMGIGKKKFPNAVLSVFGMIATTEVLIQSDGWNNWPDNVFDKDYNLMSLNDIEKYIKLNKRLPEIPSKEEIIQNGLELGSINNKLLKKIEELTLHMIQIKKENQDLKTRILKLENKK